MCVAPAAYSVTVPMSELAHGQPQPGHGGQPCNLDRLRHLETQTDEHHKQCGFLRGFHRGTPITATLISNSSGTWTYSFDTTGLATGTHTLYAEAVDSNGIFSDPLAITLTLQ